MQDLAFGLKPIVIEAGQDYEFRLRVAEEQCQIEEDAILHRLYELDLKKAEIKAYYEQLDQTLTDAARILGVDGCFKAPDGIVYQVVKYAGKFTPPSPQFDYKRTKRDGESKGSLAATTAKELEAAGSVRVLTPIPTN